MKHLSTPILLVRLARFKKEVRKLPKIEIPESIRLAAEAQGYRFNDNREKITK